MTKLLFPALLAFTLLACNGSAPKSGATPAPDALKQAAAANWKGEIPCADCEGIAYLLQLQPNDTFYERSIYLGKPGDAFVDKGTWEMSADSLVTLHNISGQTKFLAYRGEKLEILDQGRQIHQLHPRIKI
ncbi:copper resistance protein NlpE N-terminal domain-containing protein [Chitinophaga sedimenti]|uniref:copper resistance protein NlpE N-terminal domain-containing protein n=1 Tax=Chitinophaga sedimenti TaxID=2033606 RepID=UPI0020056F2B|nr:copper resistance protein NlpE N-terminal domain-containing protein [Chitinophaga sedimenti]MCK7553672.1 copper resistance protein NlpE N-terminal domain-containing protein [Chitinophaga sedimenti]